MAQHVIRTMNGKGDEPLAVWDPADEATIEAARQRFGDLIDGGYLTFGVPHGGTKGIRIKEFDPAAETIIAVSKGS